MGGVAVGVCGLGAACRTPAPAVGPIADVNNYVLPLWLIARTRQQSIALTACSQLAFILFYVMRTPGAPVVRSAYPYVIALIYLPALAILLRQPSREISEPART